jgi:hypothetical protein
VEEAEGSWGRAFGTVMRGCCPPGFGGCRQRASARFHEYSMGVDDEGVWGQGNTPNSGHGGLW